MTDNPRSITAEEYPRDTSGRFAAGNPGRPKGSRNRFAAETYRKIQEMTPDAVQSLHDQVHAGNMDAVKFVLERIVGRNRMIELQGDKPTDISDALISGEISTAEAKEIASAIEKLVKIEELERVSARLEQLERLLQG